MKRILMKSVFDAFDFVMHHYAPAGQEQYAKRKDNYAVISIQDTHTEGFGFEFNESKYCKGVLTLYFDDIIAPTEGAVLFSDEDAREIINFVVLQKNVETLLVHCYGGESRSRAVVAFIVEMCGKENAWYFNTGRPNPHVYETLVSIFERQKAKMALIKQGAGNP